MKLRSEFFRFVESAEVQVNLALVLSSFHLTTDRRATFATKSSFHTIFGDMASRLRMGKFNLIDVKTGKRGNHRSCMATTTLTMAMADR